ncbi:MAG: hypothetical protein ACJAUT_000130 [Cellvibrionaceae bacterium]|jgi:hypothetical protein
MALISKRFPSVVITVVGSITVIGILIVYIFAFKVEERFVDKLSDFADNHLKLPIDSDVVSRVDSEIRFVRQQDNFSIFYLREIMSITEVYSSNPKQEAPTGNTYKSHLIKMSIDTRSVVDIKSLLGKLDLEVKNFQWNFFEARLDANIYLIKNDDSIDIVIDVPIYSQGTWEKIRALIQLIYDITNQL